MNDDIKERVELIQDILKGDAFPSDPYSALVQLLVDIRHFAHAKNYDIGRISALSHAQYHDELPAGEAGVLHGLQK